MTLYDAGEIWRLADVRMKMPVTFRGYWYGTNKLFLNAPFFSKAFDAPDE